MTWWIATTAPSLEKRAQAELHEIGIETWLPLRCVEIKHRHMPRAEWRDYAAYPGYLFLRPFGIRRVHEERFVDGHRLWVPIGHVPHAYGPQELVAGISGLRGFVTNEGRVSQYSDDDLSALASRMVCRTHGLVEDAYRIGDVVTITDRTSPFYLFSGQVSRGKPRKESIEILLSMLGRSQPVEVPLRQLEKVA